MIAFRKSVELEENLEVVPVYRSNTGTVDLVFQSWTNGPIEYAKWQLPPDVNGRRLPGRGDIIRARWQEVSVTQIRVRVDYYDASAGIWTLDAINHTAVLNNVNGVNFLRRYPPGSNEHDRLKRLHDQRVKLSERWRPSHKMNTR